MPHSVRPGYALASRHKSWCKAFVVLSFATLSFFQHRSKLLDRELELECGLLGFVNERTVEVDTERGA